MKKALLILTLSLGLAACGSGPAQTNHADSATLSQGPKAPAMKGEGLMASSDCGTCHKADVKLVGPSYKDIAHKYTEADADKLADKVINGGSGTWGDLPMTAHPGVTKDDAKEMVKFILAQK